MEYLEDTKVLKASVLNKYINDPYIYSRFISASASDEAEIDRVEPKRGYKIISEEEESISLYNYFSDCKESVSTEFIKKLKSEVEPRKVDEFVRVLTEEWVDGHKKRYKASGVLSLKLSIKNFLESEPGYSERYVNKMPDFTEVEPLFDVHEMKAILLFTQKEIEVLLDDYIEKIGSELRSRSSSDLYMHRGLSLKEKIMSKEYIEYGFINSYSMCISSPEGFALQKEKNTAAIVSAKVFDMYGHILAFSPLIPGMPINQLEFSPSVILVVRLAILPKIISMGRNKGSYVTVF